VEVYYNAIHYTATPEDAVALALKAGRTMVTAAQSSALF